MKTNTKAVLKYALLPGIFPRAKELATSGFGYLAFLFASVYGAVRILPAEHPYLKPDNVGKFTILQTVVAAANNIQLNRRNIDQIIIFTALLLALVLMVLQFVLVILGLLTGNAFAQDKPFESMFETPYPTNDVAFLMLDYVFGIPAQGSEGVAGPNLGFFGSGAIGSGPTPFQSGMHALFKFYNLAILLVAVLIFLYFVVVVIVETAKTGVPFGKRFAKLYAPFRLIFAVGLLVPLNYGFNAAQYITLYAAKLGSSFATNGWIVYNRSLSNSGTSNNPLGAEKTTLVALPEPPSVRQLIEFSSVYHACRDMYGQWIPKDYQNPGEKVCIKPYVILDGTAREFVDDGNNGSDGACLKGDDELDKQGGTLVGSFSYEDAKKKFGTGDLEVVLGELDLQKHKGMAGGVSPYCGKITISLNHNNPKIFKNEKGAGTTGSNATNPYEQGVTGVEKIYYDVVQQMLKTNQKGTQSRYSALGERYSRATIVNDEKDTCYKSSVLEDAQTCRNRSAPPQTNFQEAWLQIDNNNKLVIQQKYTEFREGLNLALSQDIERRGWGGAGIWYNHIADINGTFTGAVYATPSVKNFPMLMEKVRREKQIQDKSISGCKMFDPNLADNREVSWGATNERDVAVAMNQAFEYFQCNSNNRAPGGTKAAENAGGQNEMVPTKSTSTTIVIEAISQIFGINGLYDLRKTSKLDESTGRPIVHPLAQLATIGKSLVENAIRSMAPAMGAAFAGGMLQAMGSAQGATLSAFSGMFVGIATIGLTAGFVLYYILPFLPFIYFFFAVGSWVKSIFEAMVGVPLWALAHLHIDGEGFSGRAAAGGYFLIFEIFLRPIVTVFGLIGSIAVFGTAATVLNTVFDQVIINVTGIGPGESAASVNIGALESFRRGVVDQFFYTIMYAILVYMIATASFKMIDTIPKGIMRWMQTGVGTFNDSKGDVAGSLSEYAAIGGSKITGQVFGGLQGGAGAAGGLVGSLGGKKG